MISVWEAIFPMSLCSFLWRFVHLAENIEPIFYWCKSSSGWEWSFKSIKSQCVKRWQQFQNKAKKKRRLHPIQNSSTSQNRNCLKLRIWMLVVNPIYAFTNTKDNFLKRVFRGSRQKGQLKTFISLGRFCGQKMAKCCFAGLRLIKADLESNKRRYWVY